MNDAQSQPQALSHNRLILTHLITKGPIDQAQSLRLYGCMRLGARIHNLRQLGFVINTEMVPNKNRGYHGRYTLDAKGTPEFHSNVKALLGK